jgi:hypothetical protein
MKMLKDGKHEAMLESYPQSLCTACPDQPDSMDPNAGGAFHGGSGLRMNSNRFVVPLKDHIVGMQKSLTSLEASTPVMRASKAAAAAVAELDKDKSELMASQKGVSEWMASLLSRVNSIISFCGVSREDQRDRKECCHIEEVCKKPEGIGAHFGFTRKIVDNILRVLGGGREGIDEGDLDGIKEIIKRLTTLAQKKPCVLNEPNSVSAEKSEEITKKYLTDIFERRRDSLRVFHMPPFDKDKTTERHFGLYIYCSNSLESKGVQGNYIPVDSFLDWLKQNGCLRKKSSGDFTLYDVENYLKENNLKDLFTGVKEEEELNKFIEERSIIFDVCCRPLACGVIENTDINCT